MAKVFVQLLGGDAKEHDFETVGEAKDVLGVPSHTALVNGEPADDGDELEEFDVVNLSPAVKGGR